jgi:hypothetical protein
VVTTGPTALSMKEGDAESEQQGDDAEKHSGENIGRGPHGSITIYEAGRLSRNSGFLVYPPSPPISWRRPEIGGTRLGLALCQPRMGGDPSFSIFLGSEFPEMADVAVGPRNPHAPSRPFVYRRQNCQTVPHERTMRSAAGLTRFQFRLWITGNRRPSCSARKRREGLR